ncbi:TFIIB-type zinc ribbon-containing protein [Nocardiopsis sp. FIRDI 009]|uniref:TFIIB-type zinc ribbon-containing protein n=1 Tax=Nocardiopsis sp. FIRDI 009 TaxID=714197 RepID=UPI000E2461D1|nr:TFIIB-type zinc ribbon-containing protein [Nocardiopsis sp. FIRDI 009]
MTGSAPRGYAYVGPAGPLALVRPGAEGSPVRGRDDLAAWLALREPAEREEPFTFVVGLDGVLRLVPRRGEHVVCAGGERILAAGEITLGWRRDGWQAVEVSNQSTGYCPDPDCWPAVADALDRAGIARPDRLRTPFVFRRCPECGERNLVKDGFFVCAFCDADLPAAWNLDGPGGGYGNRPGG